MKLDDFVSQTITEVVNGVLEAQKTCTEGNAVIAPRGQFRKSQLIEFDVAVTVESGTHTKGGIGVLTGVVNLGSTGQSDKSQTAVNRIKFKVPVLFPYKERPGV